MYQLLQLTGIASYTSPLINNILVSKGQTLKVPDDVAAKLGGSHRMNEENQPVYYFTTPRGDFKVDFDLTKVGMAPPAADGISALPAGPAVVQMTDDSAATQANVNASNVKASADMSAADTTGENRLSTDIDSIPQASDADDTGAGETLAEEEEVETATEGDVATATRTVQRRRGAK